LTASDAEGGDRFGQRVAISQDTVIVGARYSESAYVFYRDLGGTNNWGEVKKLTASDPGAGDEFGRHVALSGDTALVGAHLHDHYGIDAGSTYVYQRNHGGTDNWGQVRELA